MRGRTAGYAELVAQSQHGQHPRRRDRHGRGLRGQLIPSTAPAARTRSERFDDLVLDCIEHFDPRWREQLERLKFAVEDVPPSDPSPWEAGEVPLGRVFPADRGLPATIVVYRRPVEIRADDDSELAELVATVVVEQVAHALGVAPTELDTRYGRD